MGHSHVGEELNDDGLADLSDLEQFTVDCSKCEVCLFPMLFGQ